ncbi:MAG TPA: ABC transporter ATP-binding protein [Vicinamibacterales bacterium]|nr:ABC transporter ATP-binding protein [Vicinamibacterales bacterium]
MPGDLAVPLPFVRVDGLTKQYRRLTALDGVGFSIRRGEMLGLIGPNGAGKTTLFECLAGVRPVDGGTVAIDGRSVAPPGRGVHLFYLPDGIAPWPAQSVRWALDFTIGFFGGDRTKRDEVVGRLSIGPLLRQPIGTLSKGQRKRVILAMGLLAPQPLLLFDEPFDGLDLRQTRDVADVLREHVIGGRTLFLSIHQIADAARVCDRFVLLSGGRVRGEGTADELAAISAARGGTCGQDLEEVFLALT